MSLVNFCLVRHHRLDARPAARQQVHRPQRRHSLLPVCSSADPTPTEEPEQEEPPESSGRVQLTDSKPDRGEASGLKLQKVERLGPESWAGVAAVDRSPGKKPSWRARVVLYRGDGLAILSYALLGQFSHTGEVDALAALRTSAPFMIGWLLSGQLTDVTAQVDGGRAAAVQAAQCWAVGIPVGLALRAVYKGQLPEPSFAIVTLVYTFVALVGWRAAYAALRSDKAPARAYPARRQSSSKGNPLEFLQLLISLVKRW